MVLDMIVQKLQIFWVNQNKPGEIKMGSVPSGKQKRPATRWKGPLY